MFKAFAVAFHGLPVALFWSCRPPSGGSLNILKHHMTLRSETPVLLLISSLQCPGLWIVVVAAISAGVRCFPTLILEYQDLVCSVLWRFSRIVELHLPSCIKPHVLLAANLNCFSVLPRSRDRVLECYTPGTLCMTMNSAKLWFNHTLQCIYRWPPINPYCLIISKWTIFIVYCFWLHILYHFNLKNRSGMFHMHIPY